MARHFSKQEIDEIRRQLATYSVKDSDFPQATTLSDSDCIAIIQSLDDDQPIPKNTKVKVEQLGEDFLRRFSEAVAIVETMNLANGSVTNEKLADESVSWGKLDHNVQNIITTSGGGDIPLSTEWGDSEALGITQKKLTEEHEEVGGRLSSLEEAVGTGGSVDERIATAKAEAIAEVTGDAAQDYNTLGKIEDKLQAEETRAESVEGGLEGRLSTVEQLASISVGGGDIGIGTVEDMESSSAESRAKVPTIGALQDVAGYNNAVFNISVYNNGATYADLATALGVSGANIPTIYRNAGMSVKFIQRINSDSSTDTYVQYRLKTTAFSADTNDWAIEEDTVLIDNPEYVYVVTDTEDKILYGVKQDGDFYFGAGVPTQVSDAIEAAVDTETTRAEAAEALKANAADVYTKTAADNKFVSKADTLGDDYIFDISAYNAVGSTLATYTSLTLALAAIPEVKQKGGMTIKFILKQGESPDFTYEYVQYRLITDEYSDTETNWQVSYDPIEIENPEFIQVTVDSEDKVLYGVKTDGSFYFGAGVPQQVVDYMQGILAEYRVQDILNFMGELLDSQWNLEGWLDTKVDKETGKSLINSNVASNMSYDTTNNVLQTTAPLEINGGAVTDNIQNPEYLQVTTDSSDHILEGIKSDGTKEINLPTVINSDLQVLGSLDISGATYSLCQSPEWIKVLVDSQERIIAGVRTDGSVYIGQLDGIPADVQTALDALSNVDASLDERLQALESIISVTENPEFIQVTTDSEGKILQSRNPEGINKEYVGIETPKVSIDGATIENIQDPEGRTEIKTDSEGKILSYRDSEGVMHEEVGIVSKKTETESIVADSIILPEDALRQVDERIDNYIAHKNWYLPKFGKVNIKSETFYLTADPRWSTKDDVVCIQMLDDTGANAEARKTLSYYYIKSTLTPLAGGGYDRTSINDNSVQLQFFPGKDVVESNGQYFVKNITKVNGEYYLTSTLAKSGGVYDINYIYDQANSMKVNYIDANPDQTTLANAIEVGKVTDIPPYKAWFVGKQLEHYCVADIDFGTFYNKNNVPVGIKYQGSGSTAARKRGFRITFYKKNDYKKKDKIKIGEMVRLSGFNMKAYYTDDSRIKDPLLSNIFIEMWETRGKDAYPWNANNCIYNGATGFIKSFPIETYFAEDFYGLQFFGLKKDERNYMLDGDDDSSGIFVSGANDSLNKCFDNANHSDFEDEMMDEMSQETADALDELGKYCKGFTDGTIEIDGQTVDFTNDMLEERIDINDWVDYWIGLESFMMCDNAFHNAILYSGADKKKFSLFFYDLDVALNYGTYDDSYIDVMTNTLRWNMTFWVEFVNAYKDYIINRYSELRKNVLSFNNIESTYKSYLEQIPSRVVEQEIEKWGANFIFAGEEMLKKIKNRLDYLDINYFNIKIN